MNIPLLSRVRLTLFIMLAATGLLLSPVAAPLPHAYAKGPYAPYTHYTMMGIIRPNEHVAPPAFELKRLDGSTISLDELSGTVTLLNFWSLGCEPCKEEMPALERLWQRLGGDGLSVIAVSIDKKKERKSRKFARKHKLTFPILLDTEGTAREDYEINVLPTSYIIGRDGRFIGKVIGARRWDSELSIGLFTTLLGQKP